MTDETIKEVAKTTGKIADMLQTMGPFIGKFISGSLEQASGIWEDKLKYRRYENQIKLMIKAEFLLKKVGISTPTKTIPDKVVIPLFEYASVEEDEYLQEMWARLLVNAGNKDSHININLTYVEILKSLSSLEAKILNTLYSVSFNEALHDGLSTKNLPNKTSINPPKEEVDDKDFNLSKEIIFSLANLDRLGCLSICRSMGGGQLFSRVNPTLMGKLFIDACSINAIPLKNEFY